MDWGVMTPEIRRGAEDLSRLFPGTATYDAAWSGKMLSYLPAAWRSRAERQHAERVEGEGDFSGNTWLRELAEEMRQGAALGLDATDKDIRDAARQAAATLYELAMDQATVLSTAAGVREAAADYCIRRGIVPPGDDVADTGALARMFSSEWWLRRLRAAHGRRLEKHAQRMGYVSRKAGCYVSNENLFRRRQQKARNAAALEATTLVNQFEQEFTLAQLAEKSNANPRVRRAELMTRISGFEGVAKGLGHAAEFWTGTAPSRFHAVHIDGSRNVKHDGSTARDAQAHLVKAWAQCRAAMNRRGIRPYGFRIAEPHHDGCPHWHLLLFMPAEQVQQARDLFRHYFLDLHEASEKGARENRVKFVRIDPARGSAAGYVAKYVAKNIDGYALGHDMFGNDEITTAERVDAWAATWGIRQFQQIGGAPVGVWRELRRITADAGLSDVAEAARIAADAGVWERYIEVQGGPMVKRDDMPLRTQYTPEGEKYCPVQEATMPAENRYGEPCAKSVYGVRDVKRDRAWLSRRFKWKVKGTGNAGKAGVGIDVDSGRDQGSAVDVADGARSASGVRVSGFGNAEGGAAWTRVNNCTEESVDDAAGAVGKGSKGGAGRLDGGAGTRQGDGGEVGGADFAGAHGVGRRSQGNAGGAQ